MQSTDDDAIFALGDCAELEEDSDKTAFAADAQAVVVAKNILALVRGEEEAMVEFPGDVCFGSDRFPLVMCISLQELWDPAAELPGLPRETRRPREENHRGLSAQDR